MNKLFKKTSTGKVQEWKIWTEGNKIVVEYGYSDGKKQRKEEIIKEGKNIGRANETTPEEQAKSEAQSKWNKQKDKGYRESLDDINDSKKYLPMLAKSYDKDGHKIVWPCYAQPKLDGIRCVAARIDGKIKLLSRKGKEFKAIPHINSAVDKIIISENFCLDGELYIHGEDFQEIISAVKRDEPSDKSALVEYHIYDCFNLANLTKNFHQRNTIVNSLPLTKGLKLVDTKYLTNKDVMLKYYGDTIIKGYEGIMLRNISGVYEQDRRSQHLQKVKCFITEEFEIVGAEQNRGSMADQCTFICKTKEGYEFGVKPQGNEELREQYWRDFNLGKLTGKMLTVKYFELTTGDKPVPRFPIGLAIRDYE
jgi:DNA ligase-1